MLLTVSIVVTGDQPHLLPCLESVEAQTTVEHEVYLVAQRVSAEYLDEVMHRFPQVKLIHNQELLGFAANHNQVMRRCEAEYVILLNDDTVILDRALDRMVEFLQGQPEEVGIAGCTNLDGEGRFTLTSYPFPKAGVTIAHHSGLQRWFLGRMRQRYLSQARGAEPFAADWVVASCVAIRRAVIEEIGTLDESFFIYMEEVDYCYRARQAGFLVYQVPEARIVHYEAVTMQRFVPTRLGGLYLGTLYFLHRHGFRWDLRIVRAWYLAELSAKGLVRGIGAVAGRPPDARERLHTYLDLIGKCATYRGQPPAELVSRGRSR